MGNTDKYFVANTSCSRSRAVCNFTFSDMQPELWDPVNVTIMKLLKGYDFGMRRKLRPVEVAPYIIVVIIAPETESRQFREPGFKFLKNIKTIARGVLRATNAQLGPPDHFAMILLLLYRPFILRKNKTGPVC